MSRLEYWPVLTGFEYMPTRWAYVHIKGFELSSAANATLHSENRVTHAALRSRTR